jgi:hypothetical protein
MEWYAKQVSHYNCLADNTGGPCRVHDALFDKIDEEHEWYFKHHKTNKWISGSFIDRNTIDDLREREMTKEERMMLKATLQCTTFSGLLKTKKKGQIEVIEHSGIIQLDNDNIIDYDKEELKAAFFDLPFVGYTGLSCGGNGIFSLVLIEEPQRQTDYAEHIFEVLDKYGIPVDTSKGRNVNDLRFISYDPNPLFRKNPKPLKIKSFKKNAAPVAKIQQSNFKATSNNGLIVHCLKLIAGANVGERWQSVQKAAYTLGGLQDDNVLQQIHETININSQYAGLEEKYCECATVCFNDGKIKPF